MKQTKIFLASSSELKTDRDQFEIFINRKNKEWFDNGIFLELIIWEDFLDCVSLTRLQDEYNKAIRECDIFVMLFFTKVGKYTEEEFDNAFKEFKISHRPILFVYSKDINVSSSTSNKNDLQSIRAFQKKVRSIGHFYTVYKNIEGLHLNFNQQLERLAKINFLIPHKITDIQEKNVVHQDIRRVKKINIGDKMSLPEELYVRKNIVVGDVSDADEFNLGDGQ